MSLTTQGTVRRARLRRKLAKLYYRVNCLRNDAHHKSATQIVANKRAVVLETLGVADMLKDKRGAGALSDAALRSFQDNIQYRCIAKDIAVIKVDRWFPSTQLCSSCGERRKMSLDERVYKCACGLELGRDFNAAVNLKHYGEKRARHRTPPAARREAQNGHGPGFSQSPKVNEGAVVLAAADSCGLVGTA